MTDDRTPEQRAADENLHTAIEQVVRAYDMVDRAAVITGWAVVGSQLGATEEGDGYSDFTLLPDNGRGMSQTLLIGMLRAACLRAESAYMNPDDEVD